MKTVSPLNDNMILDAPEPEDHQPPDGDCRASACSALDLLRIRSLVADKEMLVSRANNDLAVGGYWLGDYEGWAREIQGEIDAILKQNTEGGRGEAVDPS